MPHCFSTNENTRLKLQFLQNTTLVRVIGLSVALISTFSLCSAQLFTRISPNPDVPYILPAFMLGDLNNDGLPELIANTPTGTYVHRNSGGVFADTVLYAELRGEVAASARIIDLGDVNRDGWIDILLARGLNGNAVTVLVNKHSGFDVAPLRSAATHGAVYLGDVEGDGDLDILVSAGNTDRSAEILLNMDSRFFFGQHQPLIRTPYATWVELDGDSGLESIHSLVTRQNQFIGNVTVENTVDASVISDTLLTINTTIYDAAFADYDHDGDLDVMAKTPEFKIFTRSGTDFNFSGVNFPEGLIGEFADLNNDGLYDAVGSFGMFINNDNGTFSQVNPDIAFDPHGSIALGDIDGDNDLDIITNEGVYRNNASVINRAPTPPADLAASVAGNSVMLSWGLGHDDTTPVDALTYNIEIVNQSGEILLPGHALPTGKRQIYEIGNMLNRNSFTLKSVPAGSYFWKVQALDAAFVGSVFSASGMFTIEVPAPVSPVDLTAESIDGDDVLLNWKDESVTEDGFVIWRTELANEHFELVLDTVTTSFYRDNQLTRHGTPYLYRVAAYNSAYPSSIFSQVEFNTAPDPFVETQNLDLGPISKLLLGDYDNDADLDLLISIPADHQTILFKFENGNYTDSGIRFPENITNGSWIDINQDGYLDLITASGKIFENQQGTEFDQIASNGLPEIGWQEIAWGDYDNDGDEDALIMADNVLMLFDNNNGRFSENIDVRLRKSYFKSSSAWMDFDLDGDLDILASRASTCDYAYVLIFENDGKGRFEEIEMGEVQSVGNFSSRVGGAVIWGDMDNDGYPDIIVSGKATCYEQDFFPVGQNKIYRNLGNGSFELMANLRGFPLTYDVSAEIGDFDNDGDPDVFLYGDSEYAFAKAQIFRSKVDRFEDLQSNLAFHNVGGSAVRGDIDGDGDLDYIISGHRQDETIFHCLVYKNTLAQSGNSNVNPLPPGSLESRVHAGAVELSWGHGQDMETPEEGLCYNLYLQEVNTGKIILAGNSLPNGTRIITDSRNLSSKRQKIIKKLPIGTYRWSVQTVDAGLMGSAFAPENEFSITVTGTEEDHGFFMDVFPNPVTNKFSIDLTEKAQLPAALLLVNSLGEIVLTQNLSLKDSIVNMSQQPPGMYIIIVKDRAGVITNRRVIKR